METTTESGVPEQAQAPGLTRRRLMQRGAVVGAVVWSTPVIESLTNKAFASTGSPAPGGFACSYTDVVFMLDGAGPYVVKFNQKASTCSDDNTDGMYGGGNVGPACGGVQYGVSDNNEITGNGNVIPAAPSGTCANHFTVSADGKSFSADSHVTILFVLVHDGSIKTGTVANGTTFCSPGNDVPLPSTCGG
jgi:hypothetical protein